MDPGSYLAIVDMTAKVVTLAFKTKQLWDEVKNVPSDVGNLLEELRLTGQLFSTLRSQLQSLNTFTPACDSEVMLRCFDSAMTTQCSLEGMVVELQNMLSASRKVGRHLAAVKVVLKKDVLQKSKERLNSSIRLLQLSYQM